MKLWTSIPDCTRFKISSNVQSLSDKNMQHFTTKKLRQLDNVISIKDTIKISGHVDFGIYQQSNEMYCGAILFFYTWNWLGDEYYSYLTTNPFKHPWLSNEQYLCLLVPVFTCTLCTESTASTFLSLTTNLSTISSRMLTHVYSNKKKIENHMHIVINYNYFISNTII